MRQPSLCYFLMPQLPRKIREGVQVGGESIRSGLAGVALEFSEPPFRIFLGCVFPLPDVPDPEPP